MAFRSRPLPPLAPGYWRCVWCELPWRAEEVAIDYGSRVDGSPHQLCICRLCWRASGGFHGTPVDEAIREALEGKD